MSANERMTVLGIDLGASSVGWALVSMEKGGPKSLVRAGTRVFDAGMDNLESGKDESRNKKRRQARLQRRQFERRGRRNKKLFGILQGWGWLPAGEAKSPKQRQEILTKLDQDIVKSEWFRGKAKSMGIAEPEQVMPYVLRAAALEGRLEPLVLGRALYHLGQRRGFLSNRKESAKKQEEGEEEKGKVKEGIRSLREQMKAAGARTLGEFFARLDTGKERIRARWTARSMYEEEFEAIWEAQSRQAGNEGVALTGDRRKELRQAIFFQRPLKFPRYLVGECDLEKGEKRAPARLLIAQRYRMLDKLNNLKVQTSGEEERGLTGEERNRILARLEKEGDATFSDLKKLLGLKKGVKFNLEEGGEKKIPGDRTGAALRKVFEERWDGFTGAEKDGVVEYLWSFEKAGKLVQAAMKRWGLSEEKAEALAETGLEPDYMSLSKKAMEKVLLELERGTTFAEARRRLYPEKWEKTEPASWLPPVTLTLKNMRNPAVTRSLTELRKVVNAVISKYGKPEEIRIELARDLRNSKGERERKWKEGRENEKLREEAVRKILDEMKGYKPSGGEVLRVRLWQECGGKCPYTGTAIPMNALIGGETRFDIEHIIPYHRSLDNSFANLTLCEAEHNRNVKGKRTPGEAYGSDPETYQKILERVRGFRGKFRDAKVRRFLMTTEEVAEHLENFTSRQLNDTRYATKVAADYLALLYGGRSDKEGKLRIRATAGQVTAILRGEWGLNGILNDGESSKGGSVKKSRDDHRHHAVDAIVTALTDDGTIQMLSRAAEMAQEARRRRFAPIPAPWDRFVDTVREEVERMVVSHRVSKRVRGALHEETIYSAPVAVEGNGKKGRKAGPQTEHRVRKPLSALTAKEAADIADPVVRELVREKLAEFSGAAPKNVFSVEANLPHLTAKDGRKIPIRRARVRKPVSPIALGQESRQRHVERGSNHHVEIYAELDEEGRETGWGAEVVSLFEAVRRKRAGEEIYKRSHGTGTEYRFSLGAGEIVECETDDKKGRWMFRVRGMTQESNGSVRIFLVPIEDARKKNEIEKDGDYLKPPSNTLRKWGARKVRVTPLGEVEEADD